MPVLDAVRHDLDEALQVEGLEDRRADRLWRDLLHPSLPRGCEDDNVGPRGDDGVDLLEELVAVDLRHHQIEEHQIVGLLFHALKARFAILGQIDGEPHAREYSLQENPDGQVVVDDEYPAAATVNLQKHSSMGSGFSAMMTANAMQGRVFPFRPWVRRAGASIVIVAIFVTVVMVATLVLSPRARYGWLGEPFVWLYVGALWAGGLRIWVGARHPVAELGPDTVILRPLHLLRPRRLTFGSLLGTEQMERGDRLVLYYDTARGMRFVAFNLNLVRGRKEFLSLLEGRLLSMGFVEKHSGGSRFLSPGTPLE